MKKTDIDTKVLDLFIDIFKNYLNNKKYEKSLLVFSTLSEKRRLKVIKELIEYLEDENKNQIQENKELECKNNGHIFSNWSYHEWTTYGEAWIDHQLIPDFPLNHSEWRRHCTRCGFYEEATSEPKDVREERLQKEKEEEIKKLELRLKNLKGE